MRILETIDDQSLSEALLARRENVDCFKNLGIQECFKIASLLVNDIKEYFPELKTDQAYPIDTATESHKIVARQVYLLEKIVGSVEHSQDYLVFLNSSRVLTTELIINNYNLMQALHYNDDLTVIDWMTTVGEAHECQVEASQIILDNMFPWTDMEIEKTPIKWFVEPKTEHGNTVIRGGFNGDIEEGERSIRLNLHSDAGLTNLFKAISVLHHETVHDQGFQLGYACHEGQAIKTGELIHDGEIWCAQSEAGAIVPCGISRAYNEQCIEKVAYQQQALFDKRIDDIFKIPSLKVACK